MAAQAVAYGAGAAALVLLLQVAWYLWVLSRPMPPLSADMLAVYGGQTDRYEAGWRFEKEGDFAFLTFSDASPWLVETQQAQFGAPKRATLLLEPNARTTAQNARYTAELIRDHGCRSVIVVTSWWHMPRALFLAHLALLGGGVEIRGAPASAVPERFWQEVELWRELVRFWGSLCTYHSDTRTTFHAYRVLRFWLWRHPRLRHWFEPLFF